MDAIDLLKKDHAKVTALFQRFNDGGGLTGVVKRLTGNTVSARQRRTIAEQICRELEVHAGIEEAVFYPAVRALHDERLDGMLDEAAREHGTITERVSGARQAADDDALRAAVGSLQECVDHHVRDEESQMFPLVAERMPDAERESVGRRLAAEKKRFAPSSGRKAVARKAAARKPASRRTTTAARGVKNGSTKARKGRPTSKRRAGRR